MTEKCDLPIKSGRELFYNNYLEYYSSEISDRKVDIQVGDVDFYDFDNKRLKALLLSGTNNIENLLKVSSHELNLIKLSGNDSIKHSYKHCLPDIISDFQLAGHLTEENLIKMPNNEISSMQSQNISIGETLPTHISRWTEHQKLLDIFRPYSLTSFPEYGSILKKDSTDVNKSESDVNCTGGVADSKCLPDPEDKIIQNNAADVSAVQIPAKSSTQSVATELPVAVNNVSGKKSKWSFWTLDKVMLYICYLFIYLFLTSRNLIFYRKRKKL